MEKQNHLLVVAFAFSAYLLIGAVGSANCFGFQFSSISANGNESRFPAGISRFYFSSKSVPPFKATRVKVRPSPLRMLRHSLLSPAMVHRHAGSTSVDFYTTAYGSARDGLAYYWGSTKSQTGGLQTLTADYPSNITAYDAEFRTDDPASLGSSSQADSPPPIDFSSQSPIVPRGNTIFELQQRLLTTREVPAIITATKASNLQGHAEKAFHEGRYRDAAYYSDLATQSDPHNGLVHLFCSQTHFAIGKYSVAILMLERATLMLTESRWGYVAKRYDQFYGFNDYVVHTQALADYLRRRPDDNRARTLLGYHYGCLGYKTTDSKLFHQSLQTYRNDELAQRLIPLLGDPTYTSTVPKTVDAPTPELLDPPVAADPMYLSSTGNRIIFLIPESPASGEPLIEGAIELEMEELPSPAESFFDQDPSARSRDHSRNGKASANGIEEIQSILLPQIEGPSENAK